MDAWMPTITEVKNLRERTGGGWIACRDALIDAHAATDLMRSFPMIYKSIEDVAVDMLGLGRK